MTVPIRRLVVDLLKPHEPDLVAVAEAVAESRGVDGVNAVLVETDREVQNCKLTVVGDGVDPTAVEETVDRLGGTVHSIDEVVCGEAMVEQSPTPQDR
ncbi:MULTISPECIES: DUF211 domain-containing protein [Haloprofundus]|uniref:DUF211 domain-containing protein n=1 Tax=Haloprofundus TaxID=1911573 RepID=UPI000E43420A|nr:MULTISPECIES: DUF211 domain-containing protein [Haloprofundus]QCJ45844.1 hypothetical protein FCF25_01335 [Haloprofundus sp. MHR1]